MKSRVKERTFVSC